MRIGIDIGNVIIGGDNDMKFFTDDFLSVPAVPLAFWSVMLLNMVENTQTFFISKAGPKNVEKTRLWLDSYGFWERTGSDPDSLVFCKKLEQKAPIAKLLELDVFVDDRVDICQMMAQQRITAIQFNSWPETLEIIGDLETE